MIRDELKGLFKNKLLLFVLLVIAMIPSIYAGIFLASMWDPYGDVGYLPVAVVNNDQPYEYEGKTLKIGEELTDELVDSDDMAFNHVDAETAERGLENGTYYMVITIPKDFSYNASTLMNDHPEKMVLHFDTNPGTNYVASKLSETAVKTMKAKLITKVTKTYAENVFDKLDEIGDGFDDAIDGTDQLIDGEDEIISGNKKIKKNLKVLASSTLTFKSGSETLEKGLSQYTSGVATASKGANTLNDSSTLLSNGINSLSQGSSTLKQGTSAILAGLNTMSKTIGDNLTDEKVAQIKQASAGLQSLDSNIKTFDTNMQSLNTNEQKVNTNLQTLNTNLQSLNNSTQAFNQAVQNASVSTQGLDASLQYIQGAYKILSALYESPNLTDEQKTALTSAMGYLYNPDATSGNDSATGVINQTKTGLSTTISALQKNSAAIAAGSQQIADGSAELAEGSSELASGSAALAEGSSKISEGSQQVLTPSATALTTMLSSIQEAQKGLDMTKEKDGQSGLIEGMTAVDNGVSALQTGIDGENGLAVGFKQYATGVSTLNTGLNTLVSNNNTILSGANQLSTGAGKIASGANKLATGSSTLGKGLTKLKNGTNELRDGLSDGAEKIKDNHATDKNIDMFSEPVISKETKITKVENNGHAMAAYMMTVGLWVAALAFCLIYPLCRYRRLRSGFGWWASKAVILYPLAVLMALLLILILHLALGFDPVDMKGTILAAVVTALCFMSILYFFNALIGKAGSFLMLVTMVLQLAGSAGTYPIELSGKMAEGLHKFMPFTYSVNAFRKTICGGESMAPDLMVLGALAVIFSLLIILLFAYRTHRIRHNKRYLYQWIQEKGFA